MVKIEPIHPKGLSTPFGVWTTAISVQDPQKTIYISGLTSREADGTVFGINDIAKQTDKICENLSITMHEIGGSLENIVSVTVYTTDITKFDEIHKIRRKWFKNTPPSSAMVEISRLVDEKCLIEISAVAVV